MSLKLKSKLLTNTRMTHILNILEEYDYKNIDYGANIALDMHIRKYFLKHKQTHVNDREYITDEVFILISINKNVTQLHKKIDCYWII